MTELSDVEKRILAIILLTQKEEGMMAIEKIPEALPDIPEAKISATIIKLLVDGALTEPQSGYVRILEIPTEQSVWFDPEKLPWKGEDGKLESEGSTGFIPTSPQSKKKGPYFNTKEDKKNATYKEILQKIVDSGAYHASIQGYTYWIDQYHGGISRRKIKEENKNV